jgi:hypothetical protein
MTLQTAPPSCDTALWVKQDSRNFHFYVYQRSEMPKLDGLHFTAIIIIVRGKMILKTNSPIFFLVALRLYFLQGPTAFHPRMTFTLLVHVLLNLSSD